MSVIGTNLTKINVERNEHNGKLSVKNNLNIANITKLNLKLGSTKSSGVRIKFHYNAIWEPKAATLLIEGEVMYLADEKTTEEILDNWKKKKPIKAEIMTPVMNSALRKSTIQALVLSQEMNLPSPIKLPRVTANKDKKK